VYLFSTVPTLVVQSARRETLCTKSYSASSPSPSPTKGFFLLLTFLCLLLPSPHPPFPPKKKYITRMSSSAPPKSLTSTAKPPSSHHRKSSPSTSSVSSSSHSSGPYGGPSSAGSSTVSGRTARSPVLRHSVRTPSPSQSGHLGRKSPSRRKGGVQGSAFSAAAHLQHGKKDEKPHRRSRSGPPAYRPGTGSCERNVSFFFSYVCVCVCVCVCCVGRGGRGGICRFLSLFSFVCRRAVGKRGIYSQGMEGRVAVPQG